MQRCRLWQKRLKFIDEDITRFLLELEIYNVYVVYIIRVYLYLMFCSKLLNRVQCHVLLARTRQSGNFPYTQPPSSCAYRSAVRARMPSTSEYLAVLKASYDYEPQSEDEIAIKEDQVLLLVERVDEE